MRIRAAHPAYLAAVLVMSSGALALAQGGGYGPGYGPGYGGGTGNVHLKFKAKKMQHSDESVKLKATCGTRGCVLDVRGRLKSDEGNGKLKPKRDVRIDPNERVKVKLKLNGKAKRAASDAERSTVTVKGKAIGSGGGGKDTAKKRIKLRT